MSFLPTETPNFDLFFSNLSSCSAPPRTHRQNDILNLDTEVEDDADDDPSGILCDDDDESEQRLLKHKDFIPTLMSHRKDLEKDNSHHQHADEQNRKIMQTWGNSQRHRGSDKDLRVANLINDGPLTEKDSSSSEPEARSTQGRWDNCRPFKLWLYNKFPDAPPSVPHQYVHTYHHQWQPQRLKGGCHR